MRFLNSKAVVETDCPNCDLIERHPLPSINKVRVFTCHGCAHRYTPDLSSQVAPAGPAGQPSTGRRETGAYTLRVAADWVGPPERRRSHRQAFSLRPPRFRLELLRPSWA